MDASSFWKSHITQGLADDQWTLDWTALGTTSPKALAKARVIAKAPLTWVGEGLLAAAQELEPRFEFKDIRPNGTAATPGMVLATWSGPARELLAYERPVLNLASFASGIATRTAGLVALARKACPERTPRITSTRKTLPGYRDLAVISVIGGGGHPHRVSLAGGVLIKENHIATAGGLRAAIEGVRRGAPHGLRIEAEVTSLEQLQEALAADADAVLLDNFKPEQIRKAVGAVRASSKPVLIEVSGGITEANLEQYAVSGVDLISVGSLTHSVKAADLSLLFEGASV